MLVLIFRTHTHFWYQDWTFVLWIETTTVPCFCKQTFWWGFFLEARFPHNNWSSTFDCLSSFWVSYFSTNWFFEWATFLFFLTLSTILPPISWKILGLRHKVWVYFFCYDPALLRCCKQLFESIFGKKNKNQREFKLLLAEVTRSFKKMAEICSPTKFSNTTLQWFSKFLRFSPNTTHSLYCIFFFFLHHFAFGLEKNKKKAKKTKQKIWMIFYPFFRLEFEISQIKLLI